MATKAKKAKKARAATPAVYRITEIVGTSATSWADAASNGIKAASKSLRDLRVAEVDRLDDVGIGNHGGQISKLAIDAGHDDGLVASDQVISGSHVTPVVGAAATPAWTSVGDTGFEPVTSSV